MFEERLGKGKKTAEEQKAAQNLSKNAKGEFLSMQAEQDITESLFADINVSAKQLNTENDYKNFGKKVAGVLY